MLAFVKHHSRAVTLGAAAIVVAAAAPAAAPSIADYAYNADRLDGIDSSAYRMVDLPPNEAFLDNGASFDDGAYGFGGMILPDANRPTFAYTFTVPKDYKPGTTLRVRVLWHSPSTSCTIDLRPNATAVSRPGVQHQTLGSASAGLTGPALLTAPATTKLTQVATYSLTPPKASVNPLKPLDAYQFGLFRATDSGNDTCTGALHVTGVSVHY